MANNPSYYRAALYALLMGNDMASGHMTIRHQTLAEMAKTLAFHGNAYGKSSPDVELFGDVF